MCLMNFSVSHAAHTDGQVRQIIKGCLRLFIANTLKTRKKPVVCEQDLNKRPQAQELKQTETLRTSNGIE